MKNYVKGILAAAMSAGFLYTPSATASPMSAFQTAPTYSGERTTTADVHQVQHRRNYHGHRYRHDHRYYNHHHNRRARHHRYTQAHVNWCYDRYRSYRSWDNTFQPYHGPRRQCRSPYR